MSRILDRLSGFFSRAQAPIATAPNRRKSSRDNPADSRPSVTMRGSMPALSGAAAVATAAKPESPARSSDQAAQLRSIVAETEQAAEGKAVFSENGARNEAVEVATNDKKETPEAEIVTRASSVRDLFPSRRRERQEVQARSYEQVVSLIERIGKHLDTQAERSDRMVTLLERLPDAIDALPEIQRNSEQLTSAIETHFNKQHDRDLQLRATIEELGVGAARQAEALTLIHQEVQAGHQREAEMTGVMADFRQTLSNLDHTNEQSVDVLKCLVIRAQEQESKFTGILSRQNRTLLVVAGAAVVSSLAGLTIAVIALVKVAGVG